MEQIIYREQVIIWNERQGQWYCTLFDKDGQEAGLGYYEKLADMKQWIDDESEWL